MANIEIDATYNLKVIAKNAGSKNLDNIKYINGHLYVDDVEQEQLEKSFDNYDHSITIKRSERHEIIKKRKQPIKMVNNKNVGGYGTVEQQLEILTEQGLKGLEWLCENTKEVKKRFPKK